MCHMSRVMCHLLLTITAIARDPPFLTPPLSPVGWSTVQWLQKPKKVEKTQQKNRTFFNLRKWVFRNDTHRRTDGDGDSITNSAQRAEFVKNYRNTIFRSVEIEIKGIQKYKLQK